MPAVQEKGGTPASIAVSCEGTAERLPAWAVAVGRAAVFDSVPIMADFMCSEVEMVSVSHCLTVHQNLHSKNV